MILEDLVNVFPAEDIGTIACKDGNVICDNTVIIREDADCNYVPNFEKKFLNHEVCCVRVVDGALRILID